jgi:hypothetical protein
MMIAQRRNIGHLLHPFGFYRGNRGLFKLPALPVPSEMGQFGLGKH